MYLKPSILYNQELVTNDVCRKVKHICMPQLVESCGIFFVHLKNIAFHLPFSTNYRTFAEEKRKKHMRVLIVNTSEKTGGAAVAANRLMDALNNNGVKAKMLVREKLTDDITVAHTPQGMTSQVPFLWERWCIFWHQHFSRQHLFDIDIANAGTDITSLPEFMEADLIHLHWVNQGMISLKTLRKILKSGKPVVWTMHDIWPATAVCHLTLGCHKFTTACKECKYLPKNTMGDLAAKIWQRKKRVYANQNISFVACSKWLAGEAKHSALLAGHRITSIPNPIDTHLYRARDREEARRTEQLPQDKHIILFIAQRATNPYKGMNYLIEACQHIADEHPETRENTCVAILGGHAEEFEDKLPYPVFPLGYVTDEQRIVNVYSAADVFVLPSLSENLPNTIMEAMACGVPCVGFKVGGIPEMIEHRKTGYVANYRDAEDLADGIYWTLAEADRKELREACVRKVAHQYSQHSIAVKYIEVYNEAMAYKNYHL